MENNNVQPPPTARYVQGEQQNLDRALMAPRLSMTFAAAAFHSTESNGAVQRAVTLPIYVDGDYEVGIATDPSAKRET